MKLIFSIVCCIFLSTPFAVGAYELKISPEITIDDSVHIDENLYMAGLRSWFFATLNNDMVSVALNQHIGGTIFGDVTLLGGTVIVAGEMLDDTRIIAGDVSISGITNKDLVIVANTIHIHEDAIINGNMLVLANTVISSGQFLGETQITANTITINGTVLGRAVYTAQRLTFGSGAHISNDTSYFSPQRATIETGAQIQSTLNFNQIDSIRQNDVVQKLFLALMGFWSIIKLVATLFVIFILTQIFRVFTQRVINIVHEKRFLVLPIGLLSLIVIPLFIVLLFATVVLIPISIMIALALGIVIILVPALSAIVLASLHQTFVYPKQKPTIKFGNSALMLIALTFVAFIPVVGKIIVYGLYIATFGAILYYLYEQIRRKKLNL